MTRVCGIRCQKGILYEMYTEDVELAQSNQIKQRIVEQRSIEIQNEGMEE